MPEIVTIGETMAVLAPKECGPLRYQTEYRIRAAGAESNVAAGVCKLGHCAGWVSALGKDELGHFIINAVRAEGVDCSRVNMDEEHRSGLMFKEMGGRETKVFYYREGSAASHMRFEDLDREYLKNTKILHLTGITPVLSSSCKEMTMRLADFAVENNILLSFDPNIRKRLWKGQDNREWMQELILKSDIVMMGLEEAQILFDTEKSNRILDALFNRGRVRYAAIKDGARGATVAVKEKCVKIPPFPCVPVDPVGAGDGFNAGFLCGILEEREIGVCGRMGGIAGAMATETRGDYEGYPDREQMERLLAGEEEIYR